MNGRIEYAEAFGVSHIILDLPAAPQDLGVTELQIRPSRAFGVTISPPRDARPEPASISIRFP